MTLVLPFTPSSWRFFRYIVLVVLKTFEYFFIVKPQNQYLDKRITKNINNVLQNNNFQIRVSIGVFIDASKALLLKKCNSRFNKVLVNITYTNE